LPAFFTDSTLITQLSLPGMLLFIGVVVVTADYQNYVDLKPALQISFFSADWSPMEAFRAGESNRSLAAFASVWDYTVPREFKCVSETCDLKNVK